MHCSEPTNMQHDSTWKYKVVFYCISSYISMAYMHVYQNVKIEREKSGVRWYWP